MESKEHCNMCIGDLSSTDNNFLGLKDLLPPSLISKCHVCTFNKSSCGFHCNFRLPLTTVEEVKTFVTTVKEKSFVTWRIQRTDPFKMSAGCKNLFWVEYRCQSSSKRVGKNTLNPHTKHTDCKAKMIITLKRTLVERSRTKDPHMPSYPTIVKIRHEHNHPLSSAEALRFRDVSSETTEKFKFLLRSGYSVASAVKVHKMDLQWEYGENYFQVIADRFICPDTSWVHRLCDRLFKNETKKPKEFQLHDLKEKIDEINRRSDVMLAKMEEKDSQTIVAICTPFMHCLHKLLPHSADVVFMNCLGAVDRHKHRIYVVFTYTSVGGLPLGIIITTSECEELISRGLKMIQNLVGKEAFYRRGEKGPMVFTTSESLVEQRAVVSCFPETTCLLSISYILKDMWHWLCDAEHEIAMSDRPPLMKIVNSLVRAYNEDDLVSCYTAACLDATTLKYPHFVHHLTCVWDRRHQWAVPLHQNQILEKNKTINGERLENMNDTFMHRLKAFNIIQLLDVISTRLDRYYTHRVTNFASKMLKKTILQQFMPLEKIMEDFNVKQLSEELFEVACESLNEVCQVNAQIGCCSCRVGVSGAPCKHQYSLAKKFDLSFFSFNLRSDRCHEVILQNVIVEVEKLTKAATCPKSSLESNFTGDVELALHTDDFLNQENATENHIQPTIDDRLISDEDSGINNSGDSESENCTKKGDTFEGIGNSSTVIDHDTDILARMKHFYQDIHYKLTTQSEIYQSAVEIFLQNYSTLHTDAARVCALKSFAKDFDNEVHDERKSTVQENFSGNDDVCLETMKSKKRSSFTQLEYHAKRIRTEDELSPNFTVPPR